MKKYSADYFDKKFRILFDKLIIKDGFVDVINKARKELGIPEKGFESQIEFAEYLMNRLSKKEKERTTTELGQSRAQEFVINSVSKIYIAPKLQGEDPEFPAIKTIENLKSLLKN